MWISMRRILPPRQETSRASRREHSWVLGGFVCLVVLALAAVFLEGSRVSGVSGRDPDGPGVQFAVDDPVADQFLQRFRPPREDRARRQSLAVEIVTAATEHRLDPDLLFALVAVESRFDSTAVSRSGARGLGQLMFPTAQAVAPTLVRRPRDLDNVRRNLTITARHLHELLMEQRGDLQAALTAYHLGRRGGKVAGRRDDRYVGLVCTHYASLKIMRGYRGMAVTNAESPRRAEG